MHCSRLMSSNKDLLNYLLKHRFTYFRSPSTPPVTHSGEMREVSREKSIHRKAVELSVTPVQANFHWTTSFPVTTVPRKSPNCQRLVGGVANKLTTYGEVTWKLVPWNLSLLQLAFGAHCAADSSKLKPFNGPEPPKFPVPPGRSRSLAHTSQYADGMSICSAVFACHTVIRNTQRRTDHATSRHAKKQSASMFKILYKLNYDCGFQSNVAVFCSLSYKRHFKCDFIDFYSYYC